MKPPITSLIVTSTTALKVYGSNQEEAGALAGVLVGLSKLPGVTAHIDSQDNLGGGGVATITLQVNSGAFGGAKVSQASGEAEATKKRLEESVFELECFEETQQVVLRTLEALGFYRPYDGAEL